MTDLPGRIPDAAELGLRAAAERLVSEYFARLDRTDVEGLLELYADDAVLQDAKGKAAIRQVILSTSAAVAGKNSTAWPLTIRWLRTSRRVRARIRPLRSSTSGRS